MSKTHRSCGNRERDFDDEYHDYYHEYRDHKRQKKIQRALKTMDVDELMDMEDYEE